MKEEKNDVIILYTQKINKKLTYLIKNREKKRKEGRETEKEKRKKRREEEKRNKGGKKRETGKKERRRSRDEGNIVDSLGTMLEFIIIFI